MRTLSRDLETGRDMAESPLLHQDSTLPAASSTSLTAGSEATGLAVRASSMDSESRQQVNSSWQEDLSQRSTVGHKSVNSNSVIGTSHIGQQQQQQQQREQQIRSNTAGQYSEQSEFQLQGVLWGGKNPKEVLRPPSKVAAPHAIESKVQQGRSPVSGPDTQAPSSLFSPQLPWQDFSSTSLAGVSWDPSFMVLAEGNPHAVAALGSDSSWHPSEQSELSGSASPLAGLGVGVVTGSGPSSSWDGTLSEWGHESYKEDGDVAGSFAVECDEQQQQQQGGRKPKPKEKQAGQSRLGNQYQHQQKVQEQRCEQIRHARAAAASSGRVQAASLVRQQDKRQQQQQNSLTGSGALHVAGDAAAPYFALQPFLLFQPGAPAVKPAVRHKIKKSLSDLVNEVTSDASNPKVPQGAANMAMADASAKPVSGADTAGAAVGDRIVHGQAAWLDPAAGMEARQLASTATSAEADRLSSTAAATVAAGNFGDGALQLIPVAAYTATGKQLHSRTSQFLLEQRVIRGPSPSMHTSAAAMSSTGRSQPAAVTGSDAMAFPVRDSKHRVPTKSLHRGQAKGLRSSRFNQWAEDDAEADAEASAWLAEHRRQQQMPWAALVLQCAWRSRRPRLYFGR